MKHIKSALASRPGRINNTFWLEGGVTLLVQTSVARPFRMETPARVFLRGAGNETLTVSKGRDGKIAISSELARRIWRAVKPHLNAAARAHCGEGSDEGVDMVRALNAIGRAACAVLERQRSSSTAVREELEYSS